MEAFSKDLEAFSKDLFELVTAWIISNGEGKMMGVVGGVGGGVESSGQLFLDQEDRIATGGKGHGEVASVGVVGLRDGSRCAAPW